MEVERLNKIVEGLREEELKVLLVIAERLLLVSQAKVSAGEDIAA